MQKGRYRRLLILTVREHFNSTETALYESNGASEVLPPFNLECKILEPFWPNVQYSYKCRLTAIKL